MRKVVNGSNEFYGNVGELTKFMSGNQYLQVGDVVESFDTKTKRSCGQNFICHNEENGNFIMGLACYNDEDMNKFYSNEWDFKLIRKYYDVANDEIIGCLKIVGEIEKSPVPTTKELISELIKRTDVKVIHSYGFANPDEHIYVIMTK
jgi:hypothetical protein